MAATPTARFIVFQEDDTQLTIDFAAPNGVEYFDMRERWDWQETMGLFGQLQRQTYAPRYHVDLRLRLTTWGQLCRAREVWELIREGAKFSFMLDSSLAESATLDADIAPGASATTLITVQVTDTLTVDNYYRMVDNYGFIGSGASEDTLEEAWPGYINTHLCRVTASPGSSQYLITPGIWVGFKTGAHITSEKYFNACQLLSDNFIETWDGSSLTWLWSLRFALQNPATMTAPAW